MNLGKISSDDLALFLTISDSLLREANEAKSIFLEKSGDLFAPGSAKPSWCHLYELPVLQHANQVATMLGDQDVIRRLAGSDNQIRAAKSLIDQASAEIDAWEPSPEERKELRQSLSSIYAFAFSMTSTFRSLMTYGVYATTEWLGLTLPSADDKTRSRWPVHPLWGFLSTVDWESSGGPLAKRFSPTRSPNDDKLFQMACSVILSFMAKHGFDAGQLYEAKDDLIAKLHDYIEQKAFDLGLSFDDYIAEKLALKRRQYNTAINDPEQEAKRQARELAEQARAYRKASGG